MVGVRIVAAQVLNTDDLQRILADLSAEEWGLLAAIYLAGESGMTIEVAHQIVGLFSGRRRRSVGHVAEHLKQLGLVETALRQYRHVLFVTPALYDLMRAPVFARLYPGGDALQTDPPGQQHAATLVEDTARLLALVKRGELLLTQQGQLQKRALRAVSSHMGLLDAEAEAAERYPEPLGLILAYALDRNLAVRQSTAVAPGPHLERWLDTPQHELAHDLTLFWQQRHQAGDVEAALRLLQLSTGTWWSLDALADCLAPLVNPVNRSSLRLRLEHHFSSFLAPLGAVALRKQGSSLWISALTPAAIQREMKVSLFVQPDYEIVTSRPLPPRLVWLLELMADLVHLDQRVQNFRLTSSSFYRALGLGIEAEEAIAALAGPASRGLPQNVAFDLKDWALHYGQISFAEVCVIRCQTPEMAEQISTVRKVKAFILERLNPTTLVIRRSDYEEVLEALRQEGYLPKPGIARE